MATKAALELELLEAKIRAANAEAAKSELENVVLRDDFDETLAMPHRHNHYSFIGAVRTDTAYNCMSTLTRWSRREPGCDITIVFNSPGGSVIDGLALYDHIIDLREKGHHVTTIARGMAASMGGVLLQAGDVRLVGKNAHVLIHEISTGMIGKFSEIEDEIEFCKQLQNRILDILAERSSLTVPQIRRRWKKTDWWLGSEETVEHGFADRIG
jgi:ATP-dependent Clp endopeptidase proteolytic subunit ClpP